MTELFSNVSDDIRKQADVILRIALAQFNPMQAAKFLNDVTEYYRTKWTEEEINFLQFYFQIQMEMMRK